MLKKMMIIDDNNDDYDEEDVKNDKDNVQWLEDNIYHDDNIGDKDDQEKMIMLMVIIMSILL